MANIFGDFVDKDAKDQEYLLIGFSRPRSHCSNAGATTAYRRIFLAITSAAFFRGTIARAPSGGKRSRAR